MSSYGGANSGAIRLILTPITAAWAPAFVGYYSYLTASVVMSRLGRRNAEKRGETDLSTHDANIRRTDRAHQNYLENVPTTLLLIGLAELNGGSPSVINTLLASLFLARIAHANFGMFTESMMGPGRPIGFLTSWLIQLSSAGYLFSLSWPAIKPMLGL